MINKQNFQRIIDIIDLSEKSKESIFDFNHWFYSDNRHSTVEDVVKHPCGTTACIGGWANLFSIYDEKKNTVIRDKYSGVLANFWEVQRAAKFLGINMYEAHYLFFGEWHPSGTEAPTKDVRAKLLDVMESNQVVRPEFDNQFEAHFEYEE